ncbi:MAG TPA: MFS transporter [Candidatus Eisenbacteria bacterium]|nr:MFS transporter [Candidatus Eisenbacteria bacterium]
MERVIRFGKSTFASLNTRNYRLYFIGQAISLSGTWMQTVAQGLLVLKITSSGTMLGFVVALQFLPVLLFAPLGGVIVDRFPKRNILFVTQSASGLLAVILGILVFTNTVQLWMVSVLAFALGLINSVDNPTRQSFVPEMVDKEKLTNVVTLNAWEVNLTRVIGPLIAGVLAPTIGLAACFLLNGASYLAVLFMLYLMSTKLLHPAPIEARKKGQLQEGFTYVAHSPILRNTLIMLGLVGTLTYEFTVILPIFAQLTFHNLEIGYAGLSAGLGIGAVVGGLFTANRKRTSPKMLIVASACFGLSVLIVALSPTLPVAILGMVLVGASSINFNSIGNVTLQMNSLPEMRGRVMSLWTVAFLGSTPIGGPIVGWIGEHIGPRFGLGVGALAALLAATIGLATLKQNRQESLPIPVEVLATDVHAENRTKV